MLEAVGHDLRDPINAIVGLVRLCLGTTLTTQQRDHLEKAHQAAQALQCIAHDIRDYSSLQSRALKLESIPFSLEQVLEHVARAVAPQAQRKGIELVLQKGTVGETYNIGGNNEWANIDIVNLLCALVDEAFAADATLAARFPDAPPAGGRHCRELITFVRDRAGHDRRYAIDASKINRELGYVPAESFETGIRKTIDWFLANEPWWRAILDGSYRA